jgi:hypothetical protein
MDKNTLSFPTDIAEYYDLEQFLLDEYKESCGSGKLFRTFRVTKDLFKMIDTLTDKDRRNRIALIIEQLDEHLIKIEHTYGIAYFLIDE